MSHPYRLAANRFVVWFRRSLSFLWLVVAAGYFCFMAGHAVFQNYQSQQSVIQLQQQLTSAEQERDKLQSLLVYYQTDSYKEKEVRRNLLMRLPGEKVYALPESAMSIDPADDAVAPSSTSQKSKKSALPIWRQWIDYLLKGTK